MFPAVAVGILPDLDLPVVSGGTDEVLRRVERAPVDSALVSLHHGLDLDLAELVIGNGVRETRLIAGSNIRRESDAKGDNATAKM